MPEDTEYDKSVDQILMDCMADYASDKPQRVVVIYTTEAGEVVIRSNARRCEGVGIVETAKDMLLRGGRKAE